MRPETPTKKQYNLREYPNTKNNRVSEKPWYPVGPSTEIPQLPPLIRSTENEFERRVRKALSPKKIQVSNLDPRNKYSGFKEVGTG